MHHFTVDVEEYFQVSALERHAPRHSWPGRARRLEIGLRRLLDLLAAANARATFFVLGCIAEESAPLLREVSERHEIASHGWGHRRVTTLTPAEFRESVRRSRRVLEDLLGVRVEGYRAPSFSIVRGREWALEILVEEGYTYDSSLFPIARPGYGYRGGADDPYEIQTAAGPIREYPPSVLRRMGLALPAAGGAYFRLLPYDLVRSALRDAERRGTPGMFYIHPWELDPEQPRLPVGPLTRVRHYGGLERTGARLERLLSEFRFRPIRERVEEAASV